jgi:hypothetical protein
MLELFGLYLVKINQLKSINDQRSLELLRIIGKTGQEPIWFFFAQI